jgi:tetratricopeptide (TPR) repeat protein
MISNDDPEGIRWALTADTSAELFADLNRARAALAAGKDAKAERVALAILNRLRSGPSSTTRRHGPGQLNTMLTASALAILGMVADRQGRAGEARDLLTNAASIYESLLDEGYELDAVSRAEHIRALLLIGKARAAFQIATKAFKVKTEVPSQLVLELSKVLRDSGSKDLAIELLDLAHEQQPDNADIVAALAATLEPGGPSEEVADEHIEAAILLARSGDYKRSEAHFRRALASAPDSISATSGLVQVLLMQSRADEAIQTVTPVLEQYPDTPELVAVYAAALATKGKTDAALAVARDALGRVGDKRPLVDVYVRLLLATGNAEEAAPWLNKALDQDPDDPDLLKAKADILLNENQPLEAIQILERLRDELPESFGHWVALTRALSEADRDQEAAETLAHMLATTPDDPALLQERDRLVGRWMDFVNRNSSRLGDMRIRETLEWVLIADPGNAEAHALLGEALRVQGQYADALVHLDRAVEAYPESGWVLGTRGQVLRALGRPEAVETLERAIQLDGSLSWAHTELADEYRLTGRLREAYAIVKRATALTPDDAWSWAVRGATENLLGDWEAARSSLDQAIKLAPEYSWAFAVKADLLKDIDELSEAYVTVERALKANPGIAWAWGLKAWLANALRRDPREEMAAVCEGLKRSPDDSYLHLLKAEALIRNNRSDEAEQQFQRFIDMEAGRRGLDVGTLQDLAWCHLRLRNYDEALTYLAKLLAQDYKRISASFDLGLTLLCAGRETIAMQEYEGATVRTQAERHLGHRRYLIRMARMDLDRVLQRGQVTPGRAVDRIRQILEEAVPMETGAS